MMMMTNSNDDTPPEMPAFNQIQLRFEVKNLTSQFALRKIDEIQLLEINPHELVLNLPPASCTAGHLLDITIRQSPDGHQAGPLLVDRNAPVVFQTTGKIIDFEQNPDKSQRVTMQLVQFTESQWVSFQALFEQRQADLLKIFQAARE